MFRTLSVEEQYCDWVEKCKLMSFMSLRRMQHASLAKNVIDFDKVHLQIKSNHNQRPSF